MTDAADLPLFEFDPSKDALIEPSAHLCAPSRDEVELPTPAVACFFGDVVARVGAQGAARRVASLHSEHGTHPIFAIEHEGVEVAFFQPGVGAPLAALFLEEAIDYGCRSIVACGGAGALDGSLALGQPVVVSAALRDEGTSYHYLPPGRVVTTPPDVVATLESVLEQNEVPFATGMTWSTDAVYRETRAKVARRRAEGCITVEMEASALLAVAAHRGVRLGQLLYAGDSLAGDQWDHRDWVHAHGARDALFWLAVKAAVALAR